MSATTKKWIRLSVILYVVILLFVTVATFAWFLFNDTATLQAQENMEIRAGNSLEIILVDDAGNPLVDVNNSGWNSSWGTSIDVNTPNRIFPDISGDGKNFYFPQTLFNDEPASMDYDKFIDIGRESKENRDAYYITINVKFRTTTPMDIYLSQESYVSPMAEQTESADYQNDSMFGDFSRDAIAGAVRISFSEKTSSNIELKNVWIPNDKYQLIYNEDNRDEVVDFIADGERETFKYIKVDPSDASKMIEYEYTPVDFAMRNVTLGSQQLASTTNSFVGESACLLSFNSNELINGAAEKTLVIRVWIEGTDREAHMALAEGNLNYLLSFVGIPKRERADDYTNGLTTNGTQLLKNGNPVESGKWEYSVNGIDWQTYTNGFDNTLSSVFVRSKEADGFKSSQAVLLQYTG